MSSAAYRVDPTAHTVADALPVVGEAVHDSAHVSAARDPSAPDCGATIVWIERVDEAPLLSD